MTRTYAQPHNKSNTFIIITIKNVTWGRSNKFQDTIFENNKLFEFRGVGSKLFHSVIVEGKKMFLKKLYLILKQGMLSTFLVAWVFSDISLKGYWRLCFCKFYKAFLVFCTNVVTELIPNLILGKVFP